MKQRHARELQQLKDENAREVQELKDENAREIQRMKDDAAMARELEDNATALEIARLKGSGSANAGAKAGARNPA
jgi:hypothetical protein